MAGEGGFETRPAFEIAPGNAVILDAGTEDAALCLKAQRRAKNYVQDYLVRLVPLAEPEALLEFIDPEHPLANCAAPVRIDPGEAVLPDDAGRPPNPRPGDLAGTEAGLFLAVREITPPYRFVSFVQVETGTVRRLRAHAITAVFRNWRLREDGGGD